MTDEAGCKSGSKKSKVSCTDQVEANRIVGSPSNSAGPEILAKGSNLEILLFGLSRKLLALEALVTRNSHTFVEPDRRRKGRGDQLATVAAGLLQKCVLEIVAISKMHDSPLLEITPEILNEYECLDSVSSPFYRSQERQKFLPNCLSRREREVVKHLTEGKCNKDIASTLGLSVKTVETYRARVMGKLNAHSLSDVFRFALHHKITEL
jgi:DNA-binding CsgD family transcriptional regulator